MLTYFKTFVWLMLPPPLVLLVLLLLPMPWMLKRVMVSLSDAILFFKPHPYVPLSIFWISCTVSAITLGVSTVEMLERKEDYEGAKSIGGNISQALVKLLAAERNMWISACALGLWVVLHRYRSLMKRCSMVEARESARSEKKNE